MGVREIGQGEKGHKNQITGHSCCGWGPWRGRDGRAEGEGRIKWR